MMSAMSEDGKNMQGMEPMDMAVVQACIAACTGMKKKMIMATA